MQDGAPDVGYWLGVKYWNKGYATEATRAVIDYAFTEFGHDSLSAGARVTNPASRRILEKCGFQWTGGRPVPHPRDPLVGADRPLPPRSRIVALAQELGRVKRVA